METQRLDVASAAKYVGLSRPTLNKLRVYGGGPRFLKLGKRSVRYNTADLDRWLETKLVTSTSDYNKNFKGAV